MDDGREIILLVPEFMTGIGGVEMLVINLATAMGTESKINVKVRVLCSSGSFVHQQLKDLDHERVQFLFWGEPLPKINPEALLVAWGGYGSLAKLRANNMRLLIWSVSQGAPTSHFFQQPPPFKWMRSYLQRVCWRTIRYLAEHGGVVSLDKPNHLMMEQHCGCLFSPRYLPIPIPVGSTDTPTVWLIEKSRLLSG